MGTRISWFATVFVGSMAVGVGGCSCGDDTSTGGSGGDGGSGGVVPIDNTGGSGGATNVGGSGGQGGAPLVCTAPMANCDGDDSNGCEVNTDSDPSHCGDCPTVCATGTCVAGECQTAELLLDGIATPTKLATDGATVFFNSGGHASQLYLDGAVMSIPAAGATTPTVLSSAVASPEGLALDGSNLLFSSTGTQAGDGLDGFLGRLPQAGGTIESVVPGQSFALHIVVSNGSYFWTTAGNWSGDFENGTVMKYANGATTQLADAQVYPDGIAVDDTYVYWTSIGTPAGGYLDGSVQRVPIAGGSAEVLVENLNFATGLAYADGKLYFGTKNAVNVLDLATPNQFDEFEATPKKPSLFLVDGTNLYWSEASAAGRVMRKPLGGGPSTILAEQILAPHGLAADTQYLYFAQRGTGIDDGAIYRIAK